MEANLHFVIVDELAPIGLFDAALDTGMKTRLLFNYAQGGLFDQFFGIYTAESGNL